MRVRRSSTGAVIWTAKAVSRRGTCTVRDPVVCDETVVWNLTDKPYLLYSDVVVCPTGVLQVESGVSVQAVKHSGVGIEVEGQLGRQRCSRVTQRGVHVGCGDTPAAGDWQGLVLQSSGVGTIDEATIVYATDGVQVTGSANLTATGLTVSQCSDRWRRAGRYFRGLEPDGVDGQPVRPTVCTSSTGGVATLNDVTANDNTNAGVYVNEVPAR